MIYQIIDPYTGHAVKMRGNKVLERKQSGGPYRGIPCFLPTCTETLSNVLLAASKAKVMYEN